MYDKLILDFVRTTIGLSKIFPLTKIVNDQLSNMKNKEFVKFIREKCSIKSDENGIIKYDVPWEITREHDRFNKEIEELNSSKKAITNSFIVTIISQYDVLVADLVRAVLSDLPEALSSSEKTMQLSEIIKIGNIEEIKAGIIEKEVETLLRNSHIEQIEWFEKTLSCDIKQDKEILCRFIELTERRNLCVHTNGVVSNQYLKICHDYNAQIGDCVKVGDDLKINSEYLEDAIDTIIEMSIKLVHFVWYKIHKDEYADIIKSMYGNAYWLIYDKRYKAAIRIIKYIEKMFSGKMTFEEKLICSYNKAQAYYWLGDVKTKDEILDSMDISAVSNRYLLPYYVLKEKYDDASIVMDKIGTSGEIFREEYLEWPILMKFRETEAFNTKYEKIFGISARKNQTVKEKIDEEMPQIDEDKQPELV
jgi:hypothetical protein